MRTAAVLVLQNSTGKYFTRTHVWGDTKMDFFITSYSRLQSIQIVFKKTLYDLCNALKMYYPCTVYLFVSIKETIRILQYNILWYQWLFIMAHSSHPWTTLKKNHQISHFNPFGKTERNLIHFLLKLCGCWSFLSDWVFPWNRPWNKV